MTILFIVIAGYLLYHALMLMSQGWTAMDQPPEKPKLHPEMQDVKNGEELLVVNFAKINPRDPLHQALEDRLDQGQIDDPWDDEDDDDDGGALVPAIRK